MLPTLPEKYYLAHARELFSFVEKQCAELLDPNHRDYLQQFHNLSEDAQCLLVRILSRKPRFLARSSFNYPEISNINKASEELCAAGMTSTVRVDDWRSFASVLTKPLLLQCLAPSSIKVKSSTAKAELTRLAQQGLEGDEAFLFSLRDAYIVRRQQELIDYLMFLFFGDLNNRFQKFAMRDLGVLKTRSKNKTQIARFESKPQAQELFALQLQRRAFSQNPQELRDNVADYLLRCKVYSRAANELRDKLLLKVGSEFVADKSESAIELWRASSEPAATERWIRECYKTQNRELLRIELEGLKNKSLAAETTIFIEDFYARKYQGKTTSVYTDMLREKAEILDIDEAYVGNVEHGVIRFYCSRGMQAFFTENHHWRVMFALTFWELLYGKEQHQHNEFDHLPPTLSNGQFYAEQQPAIEKNLELLEDSDRACTHFIKLASKHYGYPTGMFSWSANSLDSVIACIRHAKPAALKEVLRQMAQNYKRCKDGYPDLLVIEDGELRFEEVKAPGDTLRPNQLLSIKRLRNAGFKVAISQVKWSTDPEQVYAVVDIETTGGRKGSNAITEIAVVKVRNRVVIGEWSTLVNPLQAIPAHITHLTGINNAMVANAPRFEEVASELREQLKGTIFVAHSVGFDYGFIRAAYDSIGQGFSMPKFCTVVNSRKTFPNLKSYSLGNLASHFDLGLDNHHRALSDAKATAELLILIQQSR